MQTTTQLIIEKKVNQFVNTIQKFSPRYYIAEGECDLLFYYFPEDQNLKVEHHEDYDQIEDLCAYYEEELNKAKEQFPTILNLMKINFKKDKDIDWFLSMVLLIIQVLDPYFEKINYDSSVYYEPLADLIIEVLKNVDVEVKDRILSDVYSEYLNPENKDMYTYTFGIVIDEMLGKRKFNEVYRKRLILELETFELADHTREFYKDEISWLNKELAKRG